MKTEDQYRVVSYAREMEREPEDKDDKKHE
jgi:hypothetical protein